MDDVTLVATVLGGLEAITLATEDESTDVHMCTTRDPTCRLGLGPARTAGIVYLASCQSCRAEDPSMIQIRFDTS